jgi:hypothetical protein
MELPGEAMPAITELRKQLAAVRNGREAAVAHSGGPLGGMLGDNSNHGPDDDLPYSNPSSATVH